MPFIRRDERPLAEAISRLAFCNPFLEQRIELERAALGPEYRDFHTVWHPRADLDDDNPNVLEIARRATGLADKLRARLESGENPDPEEDALYQDVVVYVLYYRYHERLFALISPDPDSDTDTDRRVFLFSPFVEDFNRYLEHPGLKRSGHQTAQHVLACFYQLRRAFHYTFRSIAGASLPAARLRAQVWQSIFTHDLRRYQRSLFERMGEVTTLITGPSGAGKELVAHAIGLSRYIPFDAKTRRFRERHDEAFYALSLAALSPTLIESELFGHRRGAFTGAIADRRGWLEVCPPLGTVFLDEIGEVDGNIQVKLLRVLETRRFQRLGTSDTLAFHGKVLAATNRDLDVEMRAGRFREDLYYRLCADRIVAPSLHERIADSPDELRALVEVLTLRLLPSDEDEAARLCDEVVEWIDANLSRSYAWPGNVRELSQCVSNYLLHRDYRPVATQGSRDVREQLTEEFLDCRLTADELLERYCSLAYVRSGSYLEAARRVGLDRRTVRRHVNDEWVARIRKR